MQASLPALPLLLETPQKWSLAALLQHLLRLRLPKSQAVRCSNWEARPPLSLEQQHYAATDAWASLRCYEVRRAGQGEGEERRGREGRGVPVGQLNGLPYCGGWIFGTRLLVIPARPCHVGGSLRQRENSLSPPPPFRLPPGSWKHVCFPPEA